MQLGPVLPFFSSAKTEETTIMNATTAPAEVKLTEYPEVRKDGVYNVFTGMGDPRRDSTVSTFFVSEVPLLQMELESLFRFCGMARRIVSIVPGEATRQWLKFPSDTDQKMIKAMQKLNFKCVFREFLETDRLHGGAVMVLGINDGGSLEDPLDESAIKEVEFLRVYDRWQVTYTQADYYLDPREKNYGTPERYFISPYNGLESFYVHESRLMVLKGVSIPDRLRWSQLGWGDSVLQSCRDALMATEEIANSGRHLVKNMRQNIMKIAGLIPMLGGSSDMEERLIKRLNLMEMTGGLMNTMLVDAAQEDLIQVQADLSGIPAMMLEYNKRLSACTGIPPGILFGEAPSGLNANGQSEIQIFHDVIKAYQTDNLEVHINRMARLLMAAKEGDWKGRVDDDMQAEWEPLDQPTDAQKAALRFSVAQTDAIYIGNGVLDPAEVAESRFGGGHYSMDTVLDKEGREEDPERFQQLTQELTQEDKIKPPVQSGTA